MAKRGPKVHWTEKRVKTLASKIMCYAREAFDRQGEMRGLNFVGPTPPSLAECLKQNRISSRTAYDLAAQYPQLELALKKIKDAQEFILTKFTLQGGYASTFAIFAAKNMLGWKDERAAVNLNVDNSKHTHHTVITTTDGKPGTNGNSYPHTEAEHRFPDIKLS